MNPQPTCRPLLVSVVLNILLAAFLLFLFRSRDEPNTPPAKSRADQPTNALASDLQSAPTDNPSFRWSQLESPDFQVYIANLRAIGCPDQTVRDLITADVASLYRQKRNQLHLTEDAAGNWSRQEEAALVIALLGPAKADSLDSAPSENQTASNENTPAKPVLPLAFQDFSSTSLSLADSQQAAIDSLRQKFVNQIGGTNQDPNDPQYAEHWQKAQPEIDARLKVMLGNETYRQFQRQARLSQNAQ